MASKQTHSLLLRLEIVRKSVGSPVDILDTPSHLQNLHTFLKVAQLYMLLIENAPRLLPMNKRLL